MNNKRKLTGIYPVYEADDTGAEVATNGNATEASGTNSSTNNSSTNSSTGTSDEVSGFKSIYEDSTVNKLTSALNALDQKYNVNTKSKIDQLNTQKQQIMNNLSGKNADAYKKTYAYSPMQIDSTLLNIRNQLLQLKKQYQSDRINLETQLLQQLQVLSKQNPGTVSESAIAEIAKSIDSPIFESNINKAKIYLCDSIVKSGDPEKISNTWQFKKAFKNSNLVYGTDSKGCYIVCMDKNDFDEATAILTSIGYDEDEIIDCIVPQLMDRSSFLN